MKKALVLFSGGMDSLIHLHWALDVYGPQNVKALFLDFGQKYYLKELAATVELCNALKVEQVSSGDLRWLGKLEDSKAHIPMRNVFMLLTAVLQANEVFHRGWLAPPDIDIVFGMLHHESSEDKNPRFIQHMQRLFDSQMIANLYHDAQKVTIVCPFQDKTKTQMLKWYIDHGGDVNYIYKTIGCYSADEFPCGNCLSCFNRLVAITNNRPVYMSRSQWSRCNPWNWLWEQLSQYTISKEKTKKIRLGTLKQMWFKRKWLLEIWTAWEVERKRYHPVKPSACHYAYQIIQKALKSMNYESET